MEPIDMFLGYSVEQSDLRIRRLMKQVGHEHSQSLFQAFKQLEQEVRMDMVIAVNEKLTADEDVPYSQRPVNRSSLFPDDTADDTADGAADGTAVKVLARRDGYGHLRRRHESDETI